MFAVLIFLVHLAMALSTPTNNLHELHRFTRAIHQRQRNCLFNMCEVADYPTGEIAGIVEKDGRFAESFGDIVSPYNVTKITSRFNFGGEPENFCSLGIRSMAPQWARTVENKWKIVVNVPGKYQIVNFAFCRNENEACLNEDHLPTGYKTSCEQTFIKIRLVTIDDDENLTQDYFAIPSGCACMRVQQ